MSRGRLSVQRVEEDAWQVIEKLAEHGGWEGESASAGKGNKSTARSKGKGKGKNSPGEGSKRLHQDADDAGDGQQEEAAPGTTADDPAADQSRRNGRVKAAGTASRGSKRKANDAVGDIGLRRSTRARK